MDSYPPLAPRGTSVYPQCLHRRQEGRDPPYRTVDAAPPSSPCRIVATLATIRWVRHLSAPHSYTPPSAGRMAAIGTANVAHRPHRDRTVPHPDSAESGLDRTPASSSGGESDPPNGGPRQPPSHSNSVPAVAALPPPPVTARVANPPLRDGTPPEQTHAKTRRSRALRRVVRDESDLLHLMGVTSPQYLHTLPYGHEASSYHDRHCGKSPDRDDTAS